MPPKPKRPLLLVIPLLGFLLLLVVLWRGLSHDPRLLPSVLLDKPMPTFQAPRLEQPGEQINTHDLVGEIALVNIWATWCPTCRAEHEFLNALKEQGYIIYGVNYKDERDKALRWLQVLGDPYQINIDDSAGQLGIELGVYGAPETFLLDSQGVIRYRHVGALDEEIWQSEFIPRIQLIKDNS